MKNGGLNNVLKPEKIDLNAILSKQAEMNSVFRKNNVFLAYVFGSVAMERASLTSDIDFAVVFDNNFSKDEQFEREIILAGELGRIFETDKIDLVNLERATSPVLKHSAVFFGKMIFNDDSFRRFPFERKVFQEYEDTKRLRSVQFSIMKKHIKEGVFGKPMISMFNAKARGL